MNALDQFKSDVVEGLSSSPKYLPSKYFYDAKGDDLFVKIMHLPEYYLTRAELEIFSQQSEQIIEQLRVEKGRFFELIELGPGDGLKTKELLKVLIREGYDFDYLPIDISMNALNLLEASLVKELPSLSIKKQHGDFFEALHSLKDSITPKVVLFLGSNIGNLSDAKAADFIYDLGANLKTNDKLLLGVDLIKKADVVLPAYNDSKGITSEFNINLLQRINNELGADFNLNFFKHRPEYSESEGIAKSYLESTAAQEVTISLVGKSFKFYEGEKVKTEISRKYNDQIIHKILEKTDFTVTGKLVDSKEYFADYIFNRA